MAQDDGFIRVPLLFRIFFLAIEPLSTIIGAYYAALRPSDYLSLTAHVSLTTSSLSRPAQTTVEVVLAQLANLYVLFAINEFLVLSSALVNGTHVSVRGRRVWSALLTGLLIADFGHLLSVRALGWGVYWRVWEWNAMDGGNVGFVYCGAMMRISWFLGVGLKSSKSAKALH